MHLSNTLPMLGSTRNGGTRRYAPRGAGDSIYTYQRRSIRQAERSALLQTDDLADTMADATVALTTWALDFENDVRMVEVGLSVECDSCGRITPAGVECDDPECTERRLMIEAYEEAENEAADIEADARQARIAELSRGQFDPADVQWGFSVRAGVGLDHDAQTFRSTRRARPSVEDLDADHRFIDA